MDTSRDDVGIAIRSALLDRGTKQKFSLFALVVLSIIFIFIETIESKPLNYLRSFIKDTIYRSSLVVSAPAKSFSSFSEFISNHINVYNNYAQLKKENEELKNNISSSDFLELENRQLRKLIDEQVSTTTNFASARVMLDKQSPYLNSFIINIGANKNIKNGMAVLHGKNFIGRIVNVNFFSSRVLLVSDLNSRIPVIIDPSTHHAILIGHGKKKPTLDFLPENHNIENGNKIYTSGKEGVFAPGIPIGEVIIEENIPKALLFSDLNQISFINVDLGNQERDK